MFGGVGYVCWWFVLCMVVIYVYIVNGLWISEYFVCIFY